MDALLRHLNTDVCTTRLARSSGTTVSGSQPVTITVRARRVVYVHIQNHSTACGCDSGASLVALYAVLASLFACRHFYM